MDYSAPDGSVMVDSEDAAARLGQLSTLLMAGTH
jgi:hypothetical protein